MRTQAKNIFSIELKSVTRTFKNMDVLADQIADALLASSNNIVIVK